MPNPSLVFFIIMPLGTLILEALTINMITLFRDRTIHRLDKKQTTHQIKSYYD
ncbi:hypothetical protein BMETH_2179_0 [methanotrophic bacterial endosymbiont of Bathymodiolus sp.]|jgi:hypothetical protein|nr:hypothetical protein BMETH_2179_0 [methanotrophic bacterial endosymbiont of Bathymodiolus sp.]